jgi:hypothetical protein
MIFFQKGCYDCPQNKFILFTLCDDPEQGLMESCKRSIVHEDQQRDDVHLEKAISCDVRHDTTPMLIVLAKLPIFAHDRYAHNWKWSWSHRGTEFYM